jgi:hypothetical protein
MEASMRYNNEFDALEEKQGDIVNANHHKAMVYVYKSFLK